MENVFRTSESILPAVALRKGIQPTGTPLLLEKNGEHAKTQNGIPWRRLTRENPANNALCPIVA